MEQYLVRRKRLGIRNKQMLALHLKGFKTSVIVEKFGLSDRRTREIIRDMKELDTADNV